MRLHTVHPVNRVVSAEGVISSNVVISPRHLRFICISLFLLSNSSNTVTAAIGGLVTRVVMISRARCSGRGSGDGCAGLVLLRLCVILLFLKRRSGVLTIEQYTVPGFYKIARCITARMRQHPSARKVNTNATCIYFCLGETRCVFTYPATPLLQHLHLRDRLPLQRHGTRLCFALTTTTTFVPCHDI